MYTFEELCRYNSGRRLTDSGSAYGYAYEKPPITKDTPAVTIQVYNNELSATICTAMFLKQYYDIDENSNRVFIRFAERKRYQREPYYDVLKAFMKLRGYAKVAEGNTYNDESDLDQCFSYHVWQHPCDNSEWIHSDEVVVVIMIHTGCDVRWGYTIPVFVKAKPSDSYNVPIGTCVDWHLESNDPEFSDEGEFSAGYTSNPTYALNKKIKRVFTWTQTVNSVCVQLDDGTIVKATANMSYT